MQVCWEKFTRYFDVEEKFVHLTEDCYVLTPEKAIALVDENTIGACPVRDLLLCKYMGCHSCHICLMQLLAQHAM